jgi:uncharacterized protein (DUF1499 family)
MGLEQIGIALLICCSSFIGPRSGNFDGKLNYCPPTPNCVSSESFKYNPLHKISSLRYEGITSEEAFQKLKTLLDSKENVHIKIAEQGYIKTYYFTKVLRFPDTVEFLFVENSNEVQIRSQSWFGIWDVFHNRIRLEYIRKELGWK